MRNHSFDILKLFLALLVVFIHVHVPWRDTVLPLTRCAVPCFFMISGFFLYHSETTRMAQKFRKGIIRMLYILLLSNLLYVIPWGYHYSEVPDSYQLFWSDIFNFFVLGIPLFNPEGVHLWYLHAYLYVLVFFYCILIKRINLIKLLHIAVPLLFTLHILWKHCVPMAIESNNQLLFALLGYFPAYLSIAIPAVGLGILFKKYHISVIQWFNKKNSWILFVGSMLLCYMENIILNNCNIKNSGDILIFTPIAAFALMMIANLYKVRQYNILSNGGGKYSLHIYILHPFVAFAIGFIRDTMPPIVSSFYHWFSPIIVFFICIGISKFILYYQHKFQ